MPGDYANKRVLILGGLGFIGSNLAQALVQQGAELTLVDNFLPDHGANWFNLQGIRDQVQVQLSDLRQAESLAELVRGQELIFNLAAQTSHSDSMQDPFLDLDINCRGNLTLLEACRQHNPEVRVVFVGTRAFYGTPESLPVSESSAVKPQDIYAVNRLAAEQYHFVYAHHYGLPVSSLRLGNLYGPRAQMRHPRYNVLNYFMRLALSDQTIQIYGSGQQSRDYLFVQDACEALLLAGSSPQAIGQIYNVASGQTYPFVALVEQIIELAGRGAYEHVAWPAGSEAYDVGDFVTDIRLIQAELGWQPRTSLQAGIAQTLDYYRAHQRHYWS